MLARSRFRLDVHQYECAASLPRSVSEKVGVYVELLRSEDARFVRGVYLLGSVALGDYQEGRSDIDFGAVVDEPLDGRMIDRLGRVHYAMAQQHRVTIDQALAARRGDAPEISIECGMAALKFMEKVRASAVGTTG